MAAGEHPETQKSRVESNLVGTQDPGRQVAGRQVAGRPRNPGTCRQQAGCRQEKAGDPSQAGRQAAGRQRNPDPGRQNSRPRPSRQVIQKRARSSWQAGGRCKVTQQNENGTQAETRRNGRQAGNLQKRQAGARRRTAEPRQKRHPPVIYGRYM